MEETEESAGGPLPLRGGRGDTQGHHEGVRVLSQESLVQPAMLGATAPLIDLSILQCVLPPFRNNADVFFGVGQGMGVSPVQFLSPATALAAPANHATSGPSSPVPAHPLTNPLLSDGGVPADREDPQ